MKLLSPNSDYALLLHPSRRTQNNLPSPFKKKKKESYQVESTCRTPNVRRSQTPRYKIIKLEKNPSPAKWNVTSSNPATAIKLPPQFPPRFTFTFSLFEASPPPLLFFRGTIERLHPSSSSSTSSKEEERAVVDGRQRGRGWVLERFHSWPESLRASLIPLDGSLVIQRAKLPVRWEIRGSERKEGMAAR